MGGGSFGRVEFKKKKQIHWCQLAALSHTGVKLNAKDSNRLEAEKKKRKKMIVIDLNRAICSGVLPLSVDFPLFARE